MGIVGVSVRAGGEGGSMLGCVGWCGCPCFWSGLVLVR